MEWLSSCSECPRALWGVSDSFPTRCDKSGKCVFSVKTQKGSKKTTGGGVWGVGVFLFREGATGGGARLVFYVASPESKLWEDFVSDRDSQCASSLCWPRVRLCAFLCFGFFFSTGEGWSPWALSTWKRNAYSFRGQQTQDRVCVRNPCAHSGERVQFVTNIALPSPFFFFFFLMQTSVPSSQSLGSWAAGRLGAHI